MTTAYDVPADLLINKLATKLMDMEHLEEPEWVPFVKTAVHKEKAPKQDNWWFIREAAILRQVYVNGPIGTMHLRAKFCGPKNRGVKPQRVALGSGSIIRNSLQQMETAELVANIKGKGRDVTPKGRSLVDNCAYEVLQDIIKENPELGKY